MQKLDIRNRLFVNLEKVNPPWWQNILSEKGVYTDIRKDNSIDVYYNGGCIITGLKYNRGNFTGSVHYKYLLSDKSEYIKYTLGDNVQVSKNKIDLLQFTDFDKKTLKRIKANISQYYPAKSEKGIQSRFVINSGGFIDTEFAYNYGNIELRIDLVWIDRGNKKIQFVELKTMGESRLYTDDLPDQLKKYNEFAKTYECDIINYYQKLFEIKKNLRILPSGLKGFASLKGFKLEKKPLLLFGDCQQSWINNNASYINSRIKNVAVGAYYFGGTKYNCDIISNTKRNKFIF